jgi:(1->4)-alpha-D-glucan 1-alpha-D-glucosylmutase
MIATSTHDTKRGEDTRARINVLSELPDTWRRLLRRWHVVNVPHLRDVHGATAPDRNDEWLFYQTLIGTWPPGPPDAPVPEVAPEGLAERVAAYMLKAAKEAKRHTSWVNPVNAYDEAVTAFVAGALTGSTAPRFLASLVPFQRKVAWFGMINSLAQVVIKIGSPGVPDFYQGTELWAFTLVDPDNRRPVDFERHRELLRSLEPALAECDPATLRDGITPSGRANLVSQMFENWWDGRIKLFITAAALRLRRARPDVMLSGDYVPLSADTSRSHLVAFARVAGDNAAIVAVPRFLATRLGGEPAPPVGLDLWETTRVLLPPALTERAFVNLFTGEVVRPLVYRGRGWLLAGDVFTTSPVALLWAV